MIPNSPRKRLDYVAKQFPAVAWETAYVVAHTVGGDRDGIERAMKDLERHHERSGLSPGDFFFPRDGKHPNEALIPWVARELNAAMRETKRGRLTEREFVDLVNMLEAKLPQIAVWVQATSPDLTKTTVAEALSAAAKMQPDEAAPVPQGKIIYRFKDGWTVQELTTPEQIFAEGEAVQNCLREGQSGVEYAGNVKTGAIAIFSLRTPSGSPRVSMEFKVDPDEEHGGHFAQVYAKQNTSLGATLEQVLDEGGDEALYEAIQKYKPRIREFIVEKFHGEPTGLVSIGVPLDPRTKSAGGNLYLYGYPHPLPEGLTSVGGGLYLRDYPHPLPEGLTSVGGYLYLGGYKLPLPEGLTSVGGGLYLRDYPHPLPEGLTSVGGYLYLGGYKLPLPEGLTSVGGDLELRDYDYPLPEGLTSVGGNLNLYDYPHPLPEGLTSLEGDLYLINYKHPLPEGLTSVGGDLRLYDYPHPLPEGLTSVGGGLYLRDYEHPLPEGLTSVGGSLYLGNYKHPLPEGLTSVGGNLELRDYPHPLPEGLTSVGGHLRLRDYPHPLPEGLRRSGR